MGYRFEHQVQAYYLFQLIAGSDTNYGKLVQLQFQSEYEGIQTDDLICTYTDRGAQTRMFVGCKLTISARASDRAFCDALSDAWADFSDGLNDSKHPFRPAQDYLALAYSAECSTDNTRAIGRLIQIAKNSNGPADFAKKCHTKQQQDVLATMAGIVAPEGCDSPPEFLWHFLTRLKWLPLAFDGDGPVHQEIVLAQIAKLSPAPETARLVWLGLIQTAATLNGDSATVDRNNMAYLIDPSVFRALSGTASQAVCEGALSTFPWRAPLWSAQEVNALFTITNAWPTYTAEQLLLSFRALRIQCWLATGRTSDVAELAAKCAFNIDALHGSFDNKAALALFAFLNSTNEAVHRVLVHWAVRCAEGSFCLATSEVEWTLRSLYVHYYGKDASDGGRLAKYVTNISGIRSLAHTPSLLFVWHLMGYGDNTSEHDHGGRFAKLRWAIGDNIVDYRHPEQDTSAWPDRQGVVTFQALLKAVRSGSVKHMLSTYRLCTTEATFERMLNTLAELAAHVQHGAQYISANDAYILDEMRQLLDNSIAGMVSDYVTNKLVVLPIQANFPLHNEEVINIPFRNISLAAEFEASASAEHEWLSDGAAEDGSYYDPKQLWGFETVYADVMLAMTLGTKLFANSRSEAEFANTHGIGVSQLDMHTVFHE